MRSQAGGRERGWQGQVEARQRERRLCLQVTLAEVRAWRHGTAHSMLQAETTYTYLASFQRAVRARRGDHVEAERCVAYRLGVTKRAYGACSDSTWSIFRWFYQIVKLAAHAQKVQFGL